MTTLSSTVQIEWEIDNANLAVSKPIHGWGTGIRYLLFNFFGKYWVISLDGNGTRLTRGVKSKPGDYVRVGTCKTKEEAKEVCLLDSKTRADIIREVRA